MIGSVNRSVGFAAGRNRDLSVVIVVNVVVIVVVDVVGVGGIIDDPNIAVFSRVLTGDHRMMRPFGG